MRAVEDVIENEYEEWKQKRRQKRDSDEEEDIAEFLKNTYGVKGNESILEIIIGMVADNPEDSFGNNGIRSAIEHRDGFVFLISKIFKFCFNILFNSYCPSVDGF